MPRSAPPTTSRPTSRSRSSPTSRGSPPRRGSRWVTPGRSSPVRRAPPRRRSRRWRHTASASARAPQRPPSSPPRRSARRPDALGRLPRGLLAELRARTGRALLLLALGESPLPGPLAHRLGHCRRLGRRLDLFGLGLRLRRWLHLRPRELLGGAHG